MVNNENMTDEEADDKFEGEAPSMIHP